MRIVSREQLWAMPSGTVYVNKPNVRADQGCSWEGGLRLKTTSCTRTTQYVDWFYIELSQADFAEESDRFYRGSILNRLQMDTTAAAALAFDVEGRDGMVSTYQDYLYAAWEPADVQALIKRLQVALPEERVPLQRRGTQLVEGTPRRVVMGPEDWKGLEAVDPDNLSVFMYGGESESRNPPRGSVSLGVVVSLTKEFADLQTNTLLHIYGSSAEQSLAEAWLKKYFASPPGAYFLQFINVPNIQNGA